MLSKLKTCLVITLLGLAAKLKSKAETARGERVSAIRKEAMKVVDDTNKSIENHGKFKAAVIKAIEENEKRACEKAAEKYNSLELMELELMAK